MELHNSHTKLKAKHKVFPNLMVQPVKCHKENISATLSHSSATKSKDIPKLGAAYKKFSKETFQKLRNVKEE
jgi:hypothetical protein